MKTCSIGIGRLTAYRWIPRLGFALALAILGGLLTPRAYAQTTYTYTGNPFNIVNDSAYAGHYLSIVMITPVPFAPTPANTVPSTQPCPIGTIVTFSDGLNSYTTAVAPENNEIACFVFATNSTGGIAAWDISEETIPNAAFGWESYCVPTPSPNPAAASSNIADLAVKSAGAFPAENNTSCGTWKDPSPANLTAALLTQVTAMNLPSTAASLTDQIAGLEIVETLPGSSLACLDLKAIQANVASLLKHSTVTQAQANIINPWVMPTPPGYIATSLGCH